MKVVVDNSMDVDAIRAWLVTHKETTGLSWTEIGKQTDVASPTLSLFASGKYQGRNDGVAAKVSGYRQRLEVQTQLGADAPMAPEWYDTATSAQLTTMFSWAQRGKFVVVVSTPGIGKTMSAKRFAAKDPNAWLVTMSPSTAGVSTALSEIAVEIGLGDITGSPMQMSRRIRAHLTGKNGVLLIDEAQELTDKAINEIRGLHDRVGVGIVLMGNDKVVGQLDNKKSALAQVSSRISLRVSQAAAQPADIDALLDAWGITDEAQRTWLHKMGLMPGALRELTHTIEVALMGAFGQEVPLTLKHLREAAKMRNLRIGGVL